MRRRAFVIMLVIALAFSRTVQAQSNDAPLVVFLHGSALVGQFRTYIESFLAGLKDQGFENRRNVTIEYRWAEGRYERGPALAAELLALRPTAAVVYGPPGLLHSVIDTYPKEIPIVFGTGGDPIAAGIVPNFAHPGANATGVANRTNSLDVKRIELLRDLVPGAKLIGLVLNPYNSDSIGVERAVRNGARQLDRRLIVFRASNAEELERQFAAATEKGVGALLMGSDTFLNTQRDLAIALASRYRLPTIYNGREFVEAGGLLSYGANFMAVYRQVGVYTGKVLHGTKPADLPVLEPTTFELTVNVKTAKALDLVVPPALLARADEVIE